ncbi:MAG: manganese efflux pump [Candidatus Scalindua sp.]|jgi:putative Mn2+ efflux pump MntP|nr:manganese efflux pump [Candidatus Scalindua sp.]
MNLLSILIIAVGLAMDAFAVSITCGLTLKRLKIKHAFTIALSFGFFQGVMPMIGWLTGVGFRNFIYNIDHWIAFGLLVVIGGKMIYESFKLESPVKNRELSWTFLLLLSVATSIDAFAVGLSFSFLKVEIITPSCIIGAVTFILSMIGVVIGKKVGHLSERKIEAFGGIILILIGINILLTHLYQNI